MLGAFNAAIYQTSMSGRFKYDKAVRASEAYIVDLNELGGRYSHPTVHGIVHCNCGEDSHTGINVCDMCPTGFPCKDSAGNGRSCLKKVQHSSA